MGFKFSSYYNDENIKLSDERIKELLIQYFEEFPIQESDIFNEEIKVLETTSPLSHSKYIKTDFNIKASKATMEIEYGTKKYETLKSSVNVFKAFNSYKVA